ncbi:MAG: hypothetical protein AAGI66_04585 [Cyanobacteria bacterium P01_H01_bin.74]
MAVVNCKKCNKLFKQTTVALCSDCQKWSVDEKNLLLDYINKNPGLSVREIAEACSLDIKELEQKVFSGSLGPTTAKISFFCKSCKVPVKYTDLKGQFCEICAEEMESPRIKESKSQEKEIKPVKRIAQSEEKESRIETNQALTLPAERGATMRFGFTKGG